MDQQTLSKLQELIQQGEKLVPEGGLEFSGYNAKMQSQYLMWRKNCLDTLAKIGEKAVPMREKITKDENGAYFYQNSAQLILETVKQSLPLAEAEVKKNSVPPPAPPKPAAAQAPKVEPLQPKAAPQPPPPKAESLQPKAASQQAASAQQPGPKQVDDLTRGETPQPVAPNANAPQPLSPASNSKQVYVLSSSETELQNRLITFLKEINIEPIVFKRGEAMDAIIAFLDKNPNVKYAYYLFNVADVNNAMFELGYLVGKVGTNKVICIHKKEDQPPKGIPGIAYKEIVVKLEEISFGLIKDLKAAGFAVSI